MNRLKCTVKGCKNDALTLYGDSWICGECMMKIINKENERKNKMLEELEI